MLLHFAWLSWLPVDQAIRLPSHTAMQLSAQDLPIPPTSYHATTLQLLKHRSESAKDHFDNWYSGSVRSFPFFALSLVRLLTIIYTLYVFGW